MFIYNFQKFLFQYYNEHVQEQYPDTNILVSGDSSMGDNSIHLSDIVAKNLDVDNNMLMHVNFDVLVYCKKHRYKFCSELLSFITYITKLTDFHSTLNEFNMYASNVIVDQSEITHLQEEEMIRAKIEVSLYLELDISNTINANLPFPPNLTVLTQPDTDISPVSIIGFLFANNSFIECCSIVEV